MDTILILSVIALTGLTGTAIGAVSMMAVLKRG